MKTLALAIQTYPGGNAVLARHWENFKKAGADHITVITTTDGGCRVPENCSSLAIGANLYCIGKHLPSRLLRTFEALIATKHDLLCVAEYDVLFLKPIPRDVPDGFTAHLTGGKPNNCHCNFFMHPPWLMDRDTAEVFVREGYELLKTNTVDPSPDCFAGQVVERAGIPRHHDILKNYTRNTIDCPEWTREAHAAVDAGAVCIHGCKTPEVFDALTK